MHRQAFTLPGLHGRINQDSSGRAEETGANVDPIFGDDEDGDVSVATPSPDRTVDTDADLSTVAATAAAATRSEISKARALSSLRRSERTQAARQRKIDQWFRCQRCVDKGLDCTPPQLKTKQLKCRECAQPSVGSKCSTGQTLFKGFDRGYPVPPGSSVGPDASDPVLTPAATKNAEVVLNGVREAVLAAQEQIRESPEAKGPITRMAFASIEGLLKALDPTYQEAIRKQQQRPSLNQGKQQQAARAGHRGAAGSSSTT